MGVFGIFNIHYIAKYQKVRRGGPFGAIQKLSTKTLIVPKKSE